MKQKAFAKINSKEKKHYAGKQHLIKQQTTLSMQALYAALYITAIK